MKTEYLYVIVDPEGACSRIVGQGLELISLPDLISAGWRPIRETPFPHNPGKSHILICLDREPDGQMGFGFGR